MGSLLSEWMKEDYGGKEACVRRGMLSDKTEEEGKQDGAQEKSTSIS